MEKILQKLKDARPKRVRLSEKKQTGVASLQLLALQVIRQNLEKFNGTLSLNVEAISHQLFVLSKENLISYQDKAAIAQATENLSAFNEEIEHMTAQLKKSSPKGRDERKTKHHALIRFFESPSQVQKKVRQQLHVT